MKNLIVNAAIETAQSLVEASADSRIELAAEKFANAKLDMNQMDGATAPSTTENVTVEATNGHAVPIQETVSVATLPQTTALHEQTNNNNNKEKKMKEENALSAAPNQALPVVKNNIQKNDKPKVYYVDSRRFYEHYLDADEYYVTLHDALEEILGYDLFPGDEYDERLWNLIYEHCPLMLTASEAAWELGFANRDELFEIEKKEGLLCDKFIVLDDDNDPLTYYLNLDIFHVKRQRYWVAQAKANKEVAN